MLNSLFTIVQQAVSNIKVWAMALVLMIVVGLLPGVGFAQWQSPPSVPWVFQPMSPFSPFQIQSQQGGALPAIQQQPIQQPIQGQVNQHQLGAQQFQEAENILIILDASMSMSDKLPGNNNNGPTKMAAAKQAVLQVLKNVPPHVNVGLRVYGAGDKGRFRQCSDTRLVVPVGPNQQHTIASQLVGIQPNGATPISYSLIEAINNDFDHVPGKKTVLLVSDGMETCAEDPCRVAVDMQRKGIDVKMNVIGFGLDDIGAQRQLKCIALSTFGKYYTANTSAELADRLGEAMHAKAEVQGKILLPPSRSNQQPEQAVTPPPVKEKEYKMAP